MDRPTRWSRRSGGSPLLQAGLASTACVACLLAPLVLRAESDDEAEAAEVKEAGRHAPYESVDESAVFKPEGEPLEESRETPDYDAREDDRASPAEVALWVPRIALFPLHLVFEYGVRRPLGAGVSLFERKGLFDLGLDHVYEPGGPSLELSPIIKLKSDRADILGMSFVYRGAFDDRLDLGFDFAGFPKRNFLVRSHLKRHFLRHDLALAFNLETQFRDDHAFWRLGPDVQTDTAARYASHETWAYLRLESKADKRKWGGHLDVGFTDNVLRCSPNVERDLCGPDGIDETSDDRHNLESDDLAPFLQDYTLVRARTQLHWDTRKASGEGEGVRLELMGGWARSIGLNASRLHFASYGGELSGFWNVFGFEGHTLGVRLRTEMLHPLGEGRIPVPELPLLGGDETMRGFPDEQFRGLSTATATLDYRYPIWSFLNGVVLAEVGNAFGRHFQDFDPGLLRGTLGVGFQSFGVIADHTSFNFTFGVGTTPFRAEEFGIDSVEINAGTTWGF